MEPEPMKVRSIRRTEIPLFARLSINPRRTEEVLVEMFEKCESCPEWCFVGLENRKAIARIGFWVLPSIISTFHVSWLELPWHEARFKTGAELWREVLPRVRNFGATHVESAIDSDDEHHRQRVGFYEFSGLPLIQEKREYVLQPGTAISEPRPGLVFRSVKEVGTDAFLRAIERVTKGTLDREDQLARREEEPEAAAQSYFGILKDIDYTPERWLLAFTQRGALVGLAAPQMLNDTVGAVNYIGVVPEQRGKGYVRDLLSKGTELLSRAGARRVIASIDLLNTPMIAAAVRAGFKPEVTSRIYRLKL
jgi:RimJ/RimL family protein N-acetyltransferase